jgi:hypothetical protein
MCEEQGNYEAGHFREEEKDADDTLDDRQGNEECIEILQANSFCREGFGERTGWAEAEQLNQSKPKEDNKNRQSGHRNKGLTKESNQFKV